MATLLEKCNNIKNDKDTNLKPENLKAGVTCLGVTGTLTELDTSDATATSSDIAFGKTAYVNGKKVEGLVYEVPAGSSLTLEGSDAEDLPSQNKLLVTCPSEADVFFKQNSSADIVTSYDKIANAIGLTSDKLAKGNTILGIEGAAETGSASGDVKLFTTIEEMQSDEAAKEGDLAIVYGTTVSNADSNSSFQMVIFPEVVVLPEAMTGSADIMFRSNSGMFDGWCQLDSSMFMMDCYTEMGSIRVQYESSDGITYNRTALDGEGVEENLVDFGTEVYCDSSEMWNDLLGYFIQITTPVFEGLFKYTINGRTDLLRTVATSNLKFTTSSKVLIWNGKYGGPIFDLNKILKLKEQVISATPSTVQNRESGKCYFVVHNGEPYICRLCSSSNVLDIYNYGVHPCIASDGTIQGSASTSSSHILWGYKLDLENMTISELEIYPRVELATDTYGWDFSVDTASIMLDSDYNNLHYAAFMDRFFVVYEGSSRETQFTGSLHPDGYAIAKNQFTLNNSNQLFPNIVGLGKNGVITGSKEVWDNIPDTDFLNSYFGIKDADSETTPILDMTVMPKPLNPAAYGLDTNYTITEDIVYTGSVGLSQALVNNNASTGTMDYRAIQIDNMVYYLAFSSTSLLVQKGIVEENTINWQTATSLSLGIQLYAQNCTPVRYKDNNIYITGYNSYNPYVIIYNITNNTVTVKSGPSNSTGQPLSFDFDINLNKLYYHRGKAVYAWDINTSSETLLVNADTDFTNYGMYCGGTDVYTADISVNKIYLINKNTNEITAIDLPINSSTNTYGRMCFIEGDYLYIIGNQVVYKVDLNTKTIIAQQSTNIVNGSGGWGPFCHFKLEADTDHIYFVRHAAYGTFTGTNRYLKMYRLNINTLDTKEIYCPNIYTGFVLSGTINNSNTFARNRFNIISDRYGYGQEFYYNHMILSNITLGKKTLTLCFPYNAQLCITELTKQKIFE